MCRTKNAAPSAVNLYGNTPKSAPTAGTGLGRGEGLGVIRDDESKKRKGGYHVRKSVKWENGDVLTNPLFTAIKITQQAGSKWGKLKKGRSKAVKGEYFETMREMIFMSKRLWYEKLNYIGGVPNV